MSEQIPDIVPLEAATKKMQLDLARQNAGRSVKSAITPDIAASLRVKTPVQTKKPEFQSNLVMDAPPNAVIRISINKIDFFESNPRRKHDPESYQSLKESIQAKGVEQPVYVTRRPDHEGYILARGGNTRLKIMKELYQEYQEQRYAAIPCIYTPFSSDTDILFSHAVENEMHFGMYFWDKACLYANLRDAIQSENPTQKYTFRDLVEVFNKRGGLKVSLATLSIMFFASDKLADLEHLTWDLSHSKVGKISKLYSLFMNDPIVQSREVEFDRCASEALTVWVNIHSGNTELDIDKLIIHVSQAVYERFPHLVPIPVKPEPVTEAIQHEEQPVSSRTETDVSPPSSIITPIMTNNSLEKIQQIANTPDSILVIEDTIVTSMAIPQTKNAARAEIHKYAAQMLHFVNLQDLFVAHDGFTYGFYVELPDFEQLCLAEQYKNNSEKYYYQIDYIHAEARDVLYFLVDLTGQEELCHTDDSIVYRLPEYSIFKRYAVDDLFADEIKNIYLGDKPYGSLHVINWACQADSQMREAFFGLMNATYLFNKFS